MIIDRPDNISVNSPDGLCYNAPGGILPEDGADENAYMPGLPS